MHSDQAHHGTYSFAEVLIPSSVWIDTQAYFMYSTPYMYVGSLGMISACGYIGPILIATLAPVNCRLKNLSTIRLLTTLHKPSFS